MGDSTLSTVDSKFPTIKKPTNELYDEAKAIVFFPLKKTNETKDYVLGVYGSEKKKVGRDGIVTYGKAAISTSLVITSDTLSWLSNFLSAKKA